MILVAIPLAFFWRGDQPLPFDVADVAGKLDMTVVADRLDNPVSVTLTPDGQHLFIAEKAGVIRVTQMRSRKTPLLVADLRERIHDFGHRGLIDLAVDPRFPARPFLYALYSLDAPPGEQAPFWNDKCPGSDSGKAGCVVTGEVLRLELTADFALVSESVVVSSLWCQIATSHGVSEMAFGPDGLLYVAAGDGASYDFPDVGQHDDEYPAGSGRAGCPGEAEGERGALRVQDYLTEADPLTYNGAIVRFDPDRPDAGIEVVAIGLRHPFGMTFRPETDELWLVDVGWGKWEEINRVGGLSSLTRPVNFGWPCREGNFPAEGYADTPFCDKLLAAQKLTVPVHAQSREVPVTGCANPPVTFTDVVFLGAEPWRDAFAGALLVSDWGSGCVAMFVSNGGAPDPASGQAFLDNAGIVDLDVLPDGRLLILGIGTSDGDGFVGIVEPG